jgi:nitrogen regulatory protein P-II 1
MKQKMVVEDKDAEAVIDLICEFAQKGEAGDGRIFVYPVEDVVRVRTRERGCGAV